MFFLLLLIHLFNLFIFELSNKNTAYIDLKKSDKNTSLVLRFSEKKLKKGSVFAENLLN